MTEEQTKLEEILLYIPDSNRHEIEKLFKEAADELLLRSKLTSKLFSYTILEIEFYFRSKWHDDPYAHCKKTSKSENVKRQFQFGLWYFHRFKPNEEYKTRRKGLDLTFGCIEKEVSGGILIRKLKRIAGNDTPIEKSGQIVKELASSMTKEEINETATQRNLYAFSNESLLRIEPMTELRDKKVVSDVRILKRKKPKNEFSDRKYNFKLINKL